jgi:hypothetical protein
MGNHRSATAAWGASVPVAALAALLLGLAGCPTVDLGDSPSGVGTCRPAGGVQYFQDQIWPNFIVRAGSDNSCIKAGSCHAEDGGNAMNFTTMPVDYATNYRRTQPYLNCGTPEASELLTRPLAGIDQHGGQDIFMSESDPAVVIFFMWFQ